MPEELVCQKCSASMEAATAAKCPSCYRYVCENCRYSASGRYFCSSQCAHYYFFADEEEEADT